MPVEKQSKILINLFFFQFCSFLFSLSPQTFLNQHHDSKHFDLNKNDSIFFYSIESPQMEDQNKQQFFAEVQKYMDLLINECKNYSKNNKESFIAKELLKIKKRKDILAEQIEIYKKDIETSETLQNSLVTESLQKKNLTKKIKVLSKKQFYAQQDFQLLKAYGLLLINLSQQIDFYEINKILSKKMFNFLTQYLHYSEKNLLFFKNYQTILKKELKEDAQSSSSESNDNKFLFFELLENLETFNHMLKQECQEQGLKEFSISSNDSLFNHMLKNLKKINTIMQQEFEELLTMEHITQTDLILPFFIAIQNHSQDFFIYYKTIKITDTLHSLKKKYNNFLSFQKIFLKAFALIQINYKYFKNSPHCNPMKEMLYKNELTHHLNLCTTFEYKLQEIIGEIKNNQYFFNHRLRQLEFNEKKSIILVIEAYKKSFSENIILTKIKLTKLQKYQILQKEKLLLFKIFLGTWKTRIAISQCTNEVQIKKYFCLIQTYEDQLKKNSILYKNFPFLSTINNSFLKEIRACQQSTNFSKEIYKKMLEEIYQYYETSITKVEYLLKNMKEKEIEIKEERDILNNKMHQNFLLHRFQKMQKAKLSA